MSEETQELQEEKPVETAETTEAPEKTDAPAAKPAPVQTRTPAPTAKPAPVQTSTPAPAAEPAAEDAGKTKKINRITVAELNKKIQALEEKNQIQSKYYKHLVQRKNELERE